VLDRRADKLSIRVRGLELDSVAVREASRLVFRPLFGDAEAPELVAPAVWTVVEGPGDTDRETIAPTTLRPYSEDAEEESAAPAAADPAAAEAKPTTYRVRLDVGWQLLVTDEAPRLGWGRRFLAAIEDGWQRIRGREPSHPPLVVLVVAPADARRLHHVFRTGTRILVLAGD